MNTRIGMIGRWLLFLVALCGSGMVSAITVPLGTLAMGVPKESSVDRWSPNPFSFDDAFTFTLPGAGSVNVWIKDDRAASPIQNLSGEILSKSKAPGGTALNFTVTGLEGGLQYTLVVTGHSANTSPTSPKYSLGITPVPLPPAAILFGSVLVGLATMARRRWAGESA